MFHPGEAWHTNDAERALRQHMVRPRTIQRVLPNKKAADNLAILQTAHANAELLGITLGEIISRRNGPRHLYHGGRPPPISGGCAGVGPDDTAN